MRTDGLYKLCVVLMTIFLGSLALKNFSTPAEAHAQTFYHYELIRVHDQEVQGVLAKRASEGWEPVTLSFYSTSDSGGRGFLLMRKIKP